MTRILVGLAGVVVAAYGGLLLVDHARPGALLEVAGWLLGGVLLHDGVLAPLTVAVGWAASRALPPAVRRPGTVALVVLGPLTLLAVPVLGRFGAREDNPTLLDRPYVAGWLACVVLVSLGALAAEVAYAPGTGRSEMARVLVVDDDPTVREVVVSYLRAHEHEVRECADGEGALRSMAEWPADLMVLDLMLPGVDGLEVCRRVRRTSDVPIIMLTALGAEADRVVGLEHGADDYVVKPFSPRELALRVDSVLRRTGGPPALPPLLTDGDLVVDGDRHEATLAGEPLALTSREFDLLRFLMARPGTAFSRDELLKEVWGWSFGDSSTVTVHVRRLREKIETDPTRPERLVTVWGVGYRWEAR